MLVIFSGSETHKLEEIFGELPVWLAAENGVFVRPPPQHLPPAQQHGKRVRGLCVCLPWRLALINAQASIAYAHRTQAITHRTQSIAPKPTPIAPNQRTGI